VDLREDPIATFTQTSIRTRDGEHPIDMLVLATGFDAVSGSMLAINPKGRGGLSLKEKWAERFETYLGATITGFPNLFMIHGPGAPGVFFTMPLGGEQTANWIGRCICHLRSEGLGAIEATPAAETMRSRASQSARSIRARTPGIWAPISPASRGNSLVTSWARSTLSG
jgi:cyclohexanone monooxygenase